RASALFFFQADDGIRDFHVTGVQTCALPISTLGEGETSDARYHQAMIDGRRTYILSGQRGDAPFIEFTVYAGKIGLDAKSAQVRSEERRVGKERGARGTASLATKERKLSTER